jgi:hypothetical protein
MFSVILNRNVLSFSVKICRHLGHIAMALFFLPVSAAPGLEKLKANHEPGPHTYQTCDNSKGKQYFIHQCQIFIPVPFY